MMSPSNVPTVEGVDGQEEIGGAIWESIPVPKLSAIGEMRARIASAPSRVRLGLAVLLFRIHSALDRAAPVVKSGVHSAAKKLAEITAPPPPPPQRHDWQVDAGPVAGTAGERRVVEIDPQCDFYGEKVMVTDTGKTPGMGTRIGFISVGTQLQKPIGSLTPSLFFSNNTVGNGMEWDVCRLGMKIRMEIVFEESCVFHATVFGKAVLLQ